MLNIWLAGAKKHTLLVLAALLLGMHLSAHADMATILAVRAYHVDARSRVVLETSRPVNYQILLLKNPERLVLDMQDVKLDKTLRAIAGKVRTDDPYILRVRMAYFKPRVVRLVFDLKREVKPSAFTLVPMGEYQDRLVLDIYPPNGLPVAAPDKLVEHSATQPEKPDIAIPQPQANIATASKPESMPADGISLVPLASVSVETVVQMPGIETEANSDSAVSVAPPRNEKASSYSGAGLVMSSVIAACLLLLLL